MKRLLSIACLLLCPLLTSCGGMKLWGGPTAEVSTTSTKTGATYKPRYATAVYRAADEETIDVYLTDLPMARIEDGADKLDGLSGSILHVSLFLQPVAGKTPIDATACSGALRQIIIADGAMGMYSGGAFISTSSPGKETISGQVRGGSLRLARATPTFDDLLGAAAMEGKFSARYDDAACRALAQRVQDAAFSLPAVKQGPK